MTIIESVSADKFRSDFLRAYLRDGFGTLSKRETELLVLRLLLKHSSRFNYEEPPSAFALARELRISRGRARTLLDELAYRDGTDEPLVRRRLRTALLKSEKTAREGEVAIQIEDGFLREYAKSIVQSEFGKVDTSFDRSIIKITGDRFLALSVSVLEPDEAKEVERALKRYKTELRSSSGNTMLQKLSSAVAGGASAEVGALAIGFAHTALTSRFDQLSDIAAQITQRF